MKVITIIGFDYLFDFVLYHNSLCIYLVYNFYKNIFLFIIFLLFLKNFILHFFVVFFSFVFVILQNHLSVPVNSRYLHTHKVSIIFLKIIIIFIALLFYIVYCINIICYLCLMHVFIFYQINKYICSKKNLFIYFKTVFNEIQSNFFLFLLI